MYKYMTYVGIYKNNVELMYFQRYFHTIAIITFNRQRMKTRYKICRDDIPSKRFNRQSRLLSPIPITRTLYNVVKTPILTYFS